MTAFSLSFAFGVWLLQQQATLPSFSFVALLLIPIAMLRWCGRGYFHNIFYNTLIVSLALFSGFFYAAWLAQHRLAIELPTAWQGRSIDVVGVVAEMPNQHDRGSRFAFKVEQTLTPGVKVPRHIQLSTYLNDHDPTLNFHAGERWQLTVRLKQPHGTSNPYNFDFEAWALERNLRAVGYVYGKGENRRIDPNVFTIAYSIERIREAIRSHFQKILGISPYTGVLLALAIGDQGSIPPSQWQVFTRTGVNHLMSISGLHITMLAGLVFSLTYWLWRRSTNLTLWLPARKAAALAGFLVALGYALLSGYGVPAQRTVYMLGTITSALWLSRNIAPSQLLSVALMVVILLDPWSVLAPGFWLSFGAVGLIFYMTANRLGSSHWLIEYGRIQWAMSIGLIPPLLAMFQQISLVSPVANIFAIPLVSFVVVPLTLLGALLPFDWLLQLAHSAMNVCMVALTWLNTVPTAVWSQHAPPLWSILVGMFGVLWILLPRGFPARWLGAILLLPMFMILPESPSPGNLRLTIFDVGQGLAVAAQTSNHALLYDTGPIFNADFNSGNRIIIPALRGMGIAQLDTLILTHNDSDHTGGAISVMEAMPIAMVLSSLPQNSPILQHAKQSQLCSEGQKWSWDGINFELLHPSVISYRQDNLKNNDRGCVMRISIGKKSILLTADIEKNAEHRLLQTHPDKLASTLLVVPHHGSKTSSTPAFVAAIHPEYSAFTAGYRNHFGHPKAEVLERYRAIGSEILRSDEDGAILVEMNAERLVVKKYRKTNAHYWQNSPILVDAEPQQSY
jgi:competence protein ComEC